MIASVASFISYFESLRRRTLGYIAAIPAAQIDWAPRPGELTCGDLVRHLAAAEQMFVGVAVAGRWAYPGHGRAHGESLDAALAYLAASHTSAIAALGALADAELAGSRQSVGGPAIPVWRVLMLMAEHEVHHRSQIASYLSAMGVEPPQIYGLKIEQLVAQLSS